MYVQKGTDIIACIYENSTNMLPFVHENHTDIIACIYENSVNMLSFIQEESTDIFACIHENSVNMLPFVQENSNYIIACIYEDSTDNLTGIPDSTTKPPATTRVIAGGNMFCGTIILKAFLRFNHKHYAYNLLNRSLIFLLSLSTCNATFA